MPKTKILFGIIFAALWIFGVNTALEKTDSNLLNSFSKSKESSALSLLTEFDSSKRFLVFVPGFGEDSQKKIIDIANRLAKSQLFETVFFRATDTDESLKKYIASNYPYIADMNLSKLDNISVEVKKLKLQTEDPFNYKPIDKSDPFGVFNFKMSGFAFQNGLLAAGDKGYLIVAVAKVGPTDAKGSKELRQCGKTIEEIYSDAVIFAPHFFNAENSAIIEGKVKVLSIFSVAALLIIYIFILRNVRLLVFCITVLGFSVSMSAALTSIIYGQIATLALAFGAGIASIAEDYLFLLYLNKNFENKLFNKEVFVGFIVTFISLLSMSTLSDGLIAQISFFTACSIAISYCVFLYAHKILNLSNKETFFVFYFSPKPFLRPIWIWLISVSILAIASTNMRADFELQNLDYENKDLKAKAAFFVSLLESKESILIEAASKEALLEKLYTLKKQYRSLNSIADFYPPTSEIESRNKSFASLNFADIKSKIAIESRKAGFKEGYLDGSYLFLQNPIFGQNEEAVKKLGYEILSHNGAYYTLAHIHKQELDGAKKQFAYIATPKELAQEISKIEFKRFVLPALVALVIIVVALAFKADRNFLFAFNFILFPLAVLILYLSFIGNGMNLMHIFGIFLIAIYGIDYGIYLEKSMSSVNLRAVIYSLSTTFAGFGILVFSDIKAISSIGEAVCIGIVCTLLMIFQHRHSVCSSI